MKITLNSEKHKRIALSGSHGVGKTTLAKRIVNHTHYVYLPEIARELLNLIPKNLDWNWRDEESEDIVRFFQEAIFNAHLFYCNLLKDGYFVVDRTLYDAYVYLLYQYERFRDNGKYKLYGLTQSTKDLISIYCGGTNLYDLILFYRGNRALLDKEGKWIEDKLAGVLKELCDIPVIEIRRGDLLDFEDLGLRL